MIYMIGGLVLLVLLLWAITRSQSEQAHLKQEHPNAYVVNRPPRGQRPFTMSDYTTKGHTPRLRQCSWCFEETTSMSAVCSNCGWNEYTRTVDTIEEEPPGPWLSL